jgi:hypothetical protein
LKLGQSPARKRSPSGRRQGEIGRRGAAGASYAGLLPGARIVRGVSATSPQALLEVAADRVALAAILDASGRHREAEALRHALSVYERVLGANHYEVAGVLQDLAGVSERAGKPEQAAALRARALGIRRRVLGHTRRRSR